MIVPQSVQGDFIQLELADLALIYKLDTKKNFESGKKYQFDITVKKTGLKVTAKITDWDSTSGPVSGSATMREFSNIEKALKANDLLSGAVRDAEGEFKAYYFFDETFQNITSYVIGETNDKKDITVTTQSVTVSDDKIQLHGLHHLLALLKLLFRMERSQWQEMWSWMQMKWCINLLI